MIFSLFSVSHSCTGYDAGLGLQRFLRLLAIRDNADDSSKRYSAENILKGCLGQSCKLLSLTFALSKPGVKPVK